MTAVTYPRSTWSGLSLFRGGRFYVWLTLLALALAAGSLTFPSTPSYDPWSWLIWGREIFHGQLQIAGGSSWKPLPVIFTTVFAAFGSAQPNLWLIIARAGAAITVLMTVKLTVRITWSLTARRHGDGWLAGLGRIERIGAVAPSVLAGAIALVCATFTNSFPGTMMLGYSEGVMVAATLIAAERAWDGHHRQAFALGMIPSLDRPEFWIIWGPYGLWLMWKDRRAIPLVLGLGVLVLALWGVPQKLGGGTLGGLATHARNNHTKTSAVYSSFPAWTELSQKVWPLALERVEFAALAEMALTALLLWRTRRRLGGWSAALRTHAAAVAAAVSATVGFLWWVLIAIETQAGFAGNPRYALLGVMLIYVGGAAAYGWACVGLARGAGALFSRWTRRRPAAGLRLAAATAVALPVFMFVPQWFAHRMPTIPSIRYELRYQAQLREGLATLIKRDGGVQRVIACGSIMTNNFQVTMVAWYLDKPIRWIQGVPRDLRTSGPGPNVVFQDGAGNGNITQQRPTPQQMRLWNRGWQQKSGSGYTVHKTTAVTGYENCSSYYNVYHP